MNSVVIPTYIDNLLSDMELYHSNEPTKKEEWFWLHHIFYAIGSISRFCLVFTELMEQTDVQESGLNLVNGTSHELARYSQWIFMVIFWNCHNGSRCLYICFQSKSRMRLGDLKLNSLFYLTENLIFSRRAMEYFSSITERYVGKTIFLRWFKGFFPYHCLNCFVNFFF